MGLLKEQDAESRKAPLPYCCNQGENWWADSMESYTYLRNVQDLIWWKNPVIQDAISLTFITGQCINSERFLRVQLSHRTCDQIYTPSWIQDWYREDKIWAKDRRCSSRLWILWTKNTKILVQSTWKHRVLQYLQTAWKKHQNTVYWIDIRLAQKKRLKFYQTRSNAIILYNTLPAYSILMDIMMETGEIIDEKVYASLRPLPKISCRENWMKEFG